VFELQQLVVENLVDLCNQANTSINGYTELFVKDGRAGEMVRMRCHPSYRGRAWYDWCLVDYRDYTTNAKRSDPIHRHDSAVGGYPGTTPGGFFPSKLLAIIDNPLHEHGKPEHPINNPRRLCLVHMTDELTTESQLTERWRLEYSSKTITMPILDRDLNVTNYGSNRILAKVPVLRLVHPHYIRQRIAVFEEFPLVRSFMAEDDPDLGHSAIVVYLRDRRRYWSSIYDHTMKSTKD
jgi:hypothetical protein